jgi:hypothetical protein
VNDCVNSGAARYAVFPAWFALIVQIPSVTVVSAPPDVMVQTAVVEEENSRLDWGSFHLDE